MEFSTLGELSISGKGSYGIAASAVPCSKELYTYLRITDITDDGRINSSGLMSVDNVNAEKYLLQPNDIVFARTGGSTGRNYFYDGHDGEFVYAGFLIKFSINPQKVNPKFIKYYCQSKDYKEWVSSYNTGSTRGNINAQTYAGMTVPMLPRKQQDGIVSVLESIDAKIEENDHINENLEQQLQLLYDQLTYDLKGETIELSSVIEVRDGTHDSPKPKENGFPLVTSKHLLPFGVDLTSCNLISQADYNKINERSAVDTYDILLSMIGTVGLVSLVIENPVTYAIKNVGLFKTSKRPELYAFILAYLKSKKTMQHIEKTLAGSTQKYISLGELRKMPIILPTVEQLSNYNEIANPLIKQIITLTNENKTLNMLRDSILPKLMSGEIDVSAIDI